MQVYLVGGAVRDTLLGNPCHDKDYVVVGATVEEMQQKGFEKVGKSFPVFLHPQTKEEYALARKEIKTGQGHKDFEFVFSPDITLKEDSIRRDFTCNALYQNTATGEIIDFHNGIADTKNHILRHISEHFEEDALRVLRMCRLAATLNFEVAPETMALCTQMVQAGALRHLSKDRIFQEFEKALCSTKFYRFIEKARECGALKELFPEIEALWQIPERTDYHPEGNSGDHTMLALKASESNDPLVNFTVLFHDIGKTKTDPTKWPSHRGHDTLGAELIPEICRHLKAPKLYSEFASFTAQNHMLYHQSCEGIKRELTKVAITLAHNAKKDYFKRYIAVLKGDMQGRLKADFSKELAEFAQFENYLQLLYDKVGQNPISTMPNFEELINALKLQKITTAELKETYITYILNLIN